MICAGTRDALAPSARFWGWRPYFFRRSSPKLSDSGFECHQKKKQDASIPTFFPQAFRLPASRQDAARQKGEEKVRYACVTVDIVSQGIAAVIRTACFVLATDFDTFSLFYHSSLSSKILNSTTPPPPSSTTSLLAQHCSCIISTSVVVIAAPSPLYLMF